MNYEKKVVKWAAETKLFLSKQKTILRLKKRSHQLEPSIFFNLSLEEIEKGELTFPIRNWKVGTTTLLDMKEKI